VAHPKNTALSVQHWTNVCTAKSRPNVKAAGIAGADDDTNFEQAFSNLAHAYLRERAPDLLNYEQGFQLIDRDEDDTKAVGVFGFRVGEAQLLAPVFFLRGKLKGHELLYLKDQDLIVPLKEDWIAQLLNKKPELLGEGIDQQRSRRNLLTPDLNPLVAPYRKMAASVRDFAPVYAAYAQVESLDKALTRFAKVAEDLRLEPFLKQASLQTLDAIVQHCEQHPEMLQWIDQYCGPNVLSDAIKTAKARENDITLMPAQPATYGSIFKEAEPTNDLKIITFDYTEATGPTDIPDHLTYEEQTKLINDGVLIQDGRKAEGYTKAYKIQVEQRLQNPGQTGLYEVMLKPGDLEQCLVIVAPTGAAGTYNQAVVVKTGTPHDYTVTTVQNVWTVSETGREDYKDWFDKLPDADSMDESADYVVLGHRGQGSMPFRVLKDLGNGRYQVSFLTETRGLSSQYSDCNLRHKPWTEYGNIHNLGWESEYVCLNGKLGTSFRAAGSELYVPTGFKLLKLSDSNELLQLGNVVDGELSLMRKTAELKVINDGLEVSVNNSPLMSKKAGLIHLVRDHGLREAAARELLKLAEVAVGNGVRVRVKYAEGWKPPEVHYNPPWPVYRTSMGMMSNRNQEQYPQEDTVNIPGLNSRLSNLSGYRVDPVTDSLRKDQEYVAHAAQSGQREVFELGAIGAILKAMREDTLVDRYMPNLFKGLDALGRILMSLYAHGDKFADRYGQTDMPELEDNLRNAFEQLGDVILYLKQKDVQLLPQGQLNSMNLE
jgi:hypothetical protein